MVYVYTTHTRMVVMQPLGGGDGGGGGGVVVVVLCRASLEADKPNR